MEPTNCVEGVAPYRMRVAIATCSACRGDDIEIWVCARARVGDGDGDGDGDAAVE